MYSHEEYDTCIPKYMHVFIVRDCFLSISFVLTLKNCLNFYMKNFSMLILFCIRNFTVDFFPIFLVTKLGSEQEPPGGSETSGGEGGGH